MIYDGLRQYGQACQKFGRILSRENTPKFRDKFILVDVTGGTKMMSVALAMACIPPQRKMQYIDSKRDWQGNPLAKGDKAPVVIDFDPILYRQDK